MARVFFESNPISPWVTRIGERLRLRGAHRHVSVEELCLVLLHLMQDLQLHRGLSGAVLDGQSAFGIELDATEHKLERSLYALADQYGDRHPIFRQAQWRILSGRWESLRNYWRGLDFYTNLFVHSEAVIDLIEILHTLSSNYSGRLSPDRVEMISRWPKLIEQLGMLRALGLHALGDTARSDDREVAAMTDDPIDARIRSAMKDYVRDARDSLAEVSATVGDAELVVASERALLRVNLLLDEATGGAETQAFYEEMTAVIDRWYKLMTQRLLVADEKRTLAGRLSTYARFHPKVD